MATRQRKQAALRDLFRDVLGLGNNDLLPEALLQQKLSDIDDVFGLEKQETMNTDESVVSDVVPSPRLLSF